MSKAMTASINGIEQSWREAGEGPNVLVLLHGFPFSSAIWRPQLDQPPEGWRVIAPDMRGFGGTPAFTGSRLAMDMLADDVVALLRHIGVGSAVVCGHSMGGYVTFALMRRAAEMVRGLVLCDTRATPDSADAKQGRLKNAKHVHSHGTGALIDAMVPRLLHADTRTRQPHTEEELRTIMGSAPSSSVVAALMGLAERPDSTPQLRSITVPTLIVVGEHDQITPVGDARLLARAIPGARLEIVPAAGHLPALEQPVAFSRVLTTFLAGLTQ